MLYYNINLWIKNIAFKVFSNNQNRLKWGGFDRPLGTLPVCCVLYSANSPPQHKTGQRWVLRLSEDDFVVTSLRLMYINKQNKNVYTKKCIQRKELVRAGWIGWFVRAADRKWAIICSTVSGVPAHVAAIVMLYLYSLEVRHSICLSCETAVLLTSVIRLM